MVRRFASHGDPSGGTTAYTQPQANARNMRYLVFLLALLSSCSLPMDAENTERSVRAGALRVGVLPESAVASSRAGVHARELALVRRFAGQLRVDLDFRRGSVDSLTSDLEHFDLDLLIGEIEATSRLGHLLGVTVPHTERRERRRGETCAVAYVWLVPPGENGWLHHVDTFLHDNRSSAR